LVNFDFVAAVNEKRSPWNEVPAPENNYEEQMKSAEKE
jgi:hypothetical protein